MKLTRRRRLWWALMYADPRDWPIWALLAWLIPLLVGLVTLGMVRLFR